MIVKTGSLLGRTALFGARRIAPREDRPNNFQDFFNFIGTLEWSDDGTGQMLSDHFFFAHHQDLREVFFGNLNVERALVIFEGNVEGGLVGADEFCFCQQRFKLTLEHLVLEASGSNDQLLGAVLEAGKVRVRTNPFFEIFGFTNVENVIVCV